MRIVRRGARFCSTRCRVYAHRKARKAGELPREMAERARFVRFLPSKRPITTAGTPASSTDSTTWTSLAGARAATAGEGVGYVLGDGVGCIDLDHCLDGDTLEPWAKAVLDANHGTFVEVSRSGEGLHIFGLLEEGPGRKIRDGRNIEVYSAGRYIALTGKRFRGAPTSLRPLTLQLLEGPTT